MEEEEEEGRANICGEKKVAKWREEGREFLRHDISLEFLFAPVQHNGFPPTPKKGERNAPSMLHEAQANIRSANVSLHEKKKWETDSLPHLRAGLSERGGGGDFVLFFRSPPPFWCQVINQERSLHSHSTQGTVHHALISQRKKEKLL